jgi:hypothetical protein
MLRLRPVTEESQRAFFETNAELFERAAEARGEIRHTFRIADLSVRLRFAGPSLVGLIVPAFAHVREEIDGHCDLDVRLWDTASTAIEMPPPPCNRRNFTNRGEIWGFNSRRYLSAFHYGEFSVQTMDVETNEAVFWVRDASRLPFWVNASPLRSILHWRLSQAGMQLVHAAVIGTDEGAVVIPGRGGSGKSTTALLSLRKGLRYVSDDYAALSLDPEPRAYSLYCTAKLELDSIQRFSELASHDDVRRSAGYEKAVVFLHPRFEAQVARSLPIRAIALPRIDGRVQTSLGEIDALTVEQAASFTTISHLPHAGQATIEFMKRLSTEIPRVALELGSRLDTVPDAVADCARRAPAFTKVARTGLDAGRSIATHALPLVSVVIPVHNGAAFIREAVESVHAQGYPRLEVIIVNDASEDETEAIVRAFPFDVCYYDFRTNLGPAEARNRGIREAAGDFIAFLDVDDLWPEGKLERCVSILLADASLDFVQGKPRLLELDSEQGLYRETGAHLEEFPHYIGTSVFRRSVFSKVGPFDRTLRFGEDSDWYLRADEQKIQRATIDDITLLVRRHGQNMTWGKTPVELNLLRVFKGRLDRKRERGEV